MRGPGLRLRPSARSIAFSASRAPAAPLRLMRTSGSSRDERAALRRGKVCAQIAIASQREGKARKHGAGMIVSLNAVEGMAWSRSPVPIIDAAFQSFAAASL